MKIFVHTDGGARHNPGPAGIGVVIESESEVLFHHGEYIGEQTNNIAEYFALRKALQWCHAHPQKDVEQITFLLDSKLVVEQIAGRWKVKEPTLFPIFQEVAHLYATLPYPNKTMRHVFRTENTIADGLVNAALDAHLR